MTPELAVWTFHALGQLRSKAAHEVRTGVIDTLKLIQAVPTRGVAPAEVQVGKVLGEQQGGSSCACTCGIFRSELPGALGKGDLS